ncbi:MAG: DNA repair protein RecN, partial [Bacteroidales bacterium]|nr:DNA repair protein RecN [Bacteroidales bacterium]
LQQLQDAALKEDELEELEAEHRTLANAEQIQSALYAVQQALNPQEQSISSNLKDAARRLDAISSYLENSSSLSARLDSARFEIEDISEEVQSAIQRLDLSPDRLQWVEDRLSLLYLLMRKHNCADVGELIELRDKLALEVVDASSLEETIAEKQRELSAVQAELRKICAALSASRRKAAPDFASQILSSLVFLELESSRFEVRVDGLAEPTEKGADRVSFLFSSSSRGLSDVSKVASGGEISRIMLSLKAMMARFVGMPTLIFDEIDTGVSGSVADKMGQMICKMGKDMQVFSITHLPQVAAKGKAHYLVSKQGDATRPVTKISRIDGEDRINEIARLLSGATITPEAISNAKSLLHEGLS